MREKIKRPLFILISMSFFLLVLILLDEEPSKATEVQVKSHFLPQVSYTAAKAETQESNVIAYGELKPKWDVILKAQVNGAITYINPVFEAGSLVTSNTTLMGIEDIPYVSEKISAEVSLAEAKLQLLQAKKKTELVAQDWQRSGINKPPSDLALFKPQLKIAEKSFESAQLHLRMADSNLSYTRVKAPFNGIVIERLVGLGQQVVAGEPLLRLIDHQNLYLSIFLSEVQWQSLSERWLNSQAQLYSSTGDFIAMATVMSGGHRLNSETRQYPLLITVNSKENESAVSGQFVEVRIEGEKLSNYLRLPESALTREGTVWFIDKQDTLRSYQPKDIHYQDKHVLVPMPANPEYLGQNIWRVATVPLASFLAGKQVNPTDVKVEK
ncbi:MAG: RND family efflux transporter MFP subunit [Oleispira sp.]|jgi:RND family efflux transporter MFP subunit